MMLAKTLALLAVAMRQKRLVPVTGLALFVLCAGYGWPQQPAVKNASARSLPALHTRAEFDSLAVEYDANTPYALPHVLFVIDRQDKNRIYYVNTKRYAFHKDFVNGTYLSLERGQAFFEIPRLTDRPTLFVRRAQ